MPAVWSRSAAFQLSRSRGWHFAGVFFKSAMMAARSSARRDNAGLIHSDASTKFADMQTHAGKHEHFGHGKRGQAGTPGT